MAKTPPIELEFSRKYDHTHAYKYLQKHRHGVARRASHWRDEQLARRALKLAGEPAVVLDLPCGAGRFWPLLAEQPHRIIFAADNSANMLAVARASQPATLLKQVQSFQTSAFAIDMPADAVDSIFCMRLLHHISDPAHRLSMLRELYPRKSRQPDCLALGRWQLQSLEAQASGTAPARQSQPESLRNPQNSHRGGVRPSRLRHHRPLRLSAGLCHVAGLCVA